MMIIGVDYHPSFQTIAFLMEEKFDREDARLLLRLMRENNKFS